MTRVRPAALLAASSALLLFALAACESGPNHASTYPDGKTAVENTDTVSYLDDFGRDLRVAGQKAEFLPDRRLKVFANLQNESDEDLPVLVSTQFKDKDGFSTGDETPFVNIVIPKNSLYAYQAISQNEKAVKYSIRVREGVR